jgi:hypothetical protein
MTEEQFVALLRTLADKDRHPFQRAEAVDAVLKEFRRLRKIEEASKK